MNILIHIYLISDEDIINFCKLIDVSNNIDYWNLFYSFFTNDWIRITVNKLSDENFCQQYLYLLSFADSYENIEIGNLYALISLARKNILNILYDISSEERFLSSFGFFNNRLERQRLEILKFVAENNILPTFREANLAAKNGHLKILKWLFEKNIFPDKEGINWALYNNHSEVIEWLYNRGLYSRELETLKWLSEKRIF